MPTVTRVCSAMLCITLAVVSGATVQEELFGLPVGHLDIQERPDGTINVTAWAAPLRTVLEAVAERTGKPVVFDCDVKSCISICESWQWKSPDKWLERVASKAHSYCTKREDGWHVGSIARDYNVCLTEAEITERYTRVFSPEKPRSGLERILIYGGCYIPKPYEIVVRQASDDEYCVTINGLEVAAFGPLPAPPAPSKLPPSSGIIPMPQPGGEPPSPGEGAEHHAEFLGCHMEVGDVMALSASGGIIATNRLSPAMHAAFAEALAPGRSFFEREVLLGEILGDGQLAREAAVNLPRDREVFLRDLARVAAGGDKGADPEIDAGNVEEVRADATAGPPTEAPSNVASAYPLPEAQPITFPDGPPTLEMDVLGNPPRMVSFPWQSTGLTLVKGDVLYLRAKGEIRWSMTQTEPPCGPDGMGNSNPDSVIPNVSCGALIGRVGGELLDDGVDSSGKGTYGPGFVGSRFKWTKRSERPGELQLMFHDRGHGDNSGSFRVAIWVVPSGEALAARELRRPDHVDRGGADGSGDVVWGNTRFALDLYEMLAQEEGNLFFSPFSISTALAMTYAGARGQTRAQMREVLHFPSDDEELHACLAALGEELNKSGEVRLSIANRLWGQANCPFRDAFLDLTRTYYGAELAQVDFEHNAEGARRQINIWVAGKTEHKIQDLLGSGVVDEQTRLVLTNAIYFKGEWAMPFRERATREEPFFVEPSTTVVVPMMRGTIDLRYVESADYQAVELPYNGGELAMLIVLPVERFGLREVERSASEQELEVLLNHLEPRHMQVCLPRFKLEDGFRLAGTLQAMGIVDAFSTSGQADFSGMADLAPGVLFISAVVHKAYVDVDESGTEAAAATAVAIALGLPDTRQAPVFRADHPFLFLIRDVRSGSIVFAGRVVNPAS